MLNANFSASGTLFPFLSPVYSINKWLSRIILAKQVAVLIFVTSCDKFLSPKFSKLCQRSEKITDSLVITNIKQLLFFEVFLIMF